MKKTLLSLLAVAATVSTAAAQVEIGLKVSPGVAFLRADGPSKNPFDSEGSKFSFGGGLVVDYFFGENYAFSTGLQLTGKGGSYSYRYTNSAGVTTTSSVEKLSTQYLELPIALKLFTNEIAPDMRLYFQLGGSLAVPIGARINDSKTFIYQDPSGNIQETKALDHVFFFDVNALAGLGVEYQLAKSTKAFGGFSYHRGLIDLDRYFEKERGFSDVNIRNNVVALDLGLKF